MGILTSEFGMERLYEVTQGTLRWKTAGVFREPETPALPSDAPPRRQPGPNHIGWLSSSLHANMGQSLGGNELRMTAQQYELDWADDSRPGKKT